MSKATGTTGFSLGIIIFHLSNVFPLPASQPQPTHPIPGFAILRQIENGWRGIECLTGSIYLSIEDGVDVYGWGGCGGDKKGKIN